MTNIDICLALETLCPGAEYNVWGTDLSGITWLDHEKVRPSDDAITAWIAANRP